MHNTTQSNIKAVQYHLCETFKVTCFVFTLALATLALDDLALDCILQKCVSKMFLPTFTSIGNTLGNKKAIHRETTTTALKCTHIHTVDRVMDLDTDAHERLR